MSHSLSWTVTQMVECVIAQWVYSMLNMVFQCSETHRAREKTDDEQMEAVNNCHCLLCGSTEGWTLEYVQTQTHLSSAKLNSFIPSWKVRQWKEPVSSNFIQNSSRTVCQTYHMVSMNDKAKSGNWPISVGQGILFTAKKLYFHIKWKNETNN